MLFKEYDCAGKADTYFIPSYELPEHMEPTKDRRRCWDEMVKEKKAGRHFYVKRWREVESIRLPKQDEYDLCEPYGDQVCQARMENMRLRSSRKELDQERRGNVVPEIKIDAINPGLQRMKPTEWSFACATTRSKTADELAEEAADNLLSPTSTRVPNNPFAPMSPFRSKSAPVSTTSKSSKEKKEVGKEHKGHKGLKFWRRKSA